MKRKKINRRQQYRALLSDVLPYEMPFIFSNNGFFKYVQRYCGKNNVKRHEERARLFHVLMNVLQGDANRPKASFSYTIRKGIEKKEDTVEIKRRTLTLPHPFYQIRVASLYGKYSDFLLYHTTRSKFSIRLPYKVASYKGVQKDTFPKDLLLEDNSGEDDNPKHYFVYKRYQNINGFYDGYWFQQLEKRYSFHLRTDIKHCFDNIKPEMLYKAVFGTEVEDKGHEIITELVDLQKIMFVGEPKENGNKESTGVMIGPEFSRIYVEIILQAVDRELEYELKKRGYKSGKEYVFCRYVDDGFFFCNKQELLDEFVEIYKKTLEKWCLEINEKKTESLCLHPFLDSLTVAKRELMLVVEKMFVNREDTLIGIENRSLGSYRDVPFKIKSKYFIRDIQGVVAKYRIQYEDVTSSFLSCIRRKLRDDVYKSFYHSFIKYKDAELRSCIDDEGKRILNRYESSFVEFCGELVSLLFYVFACDPRMATSLKVEQIIVELLAYVKGMYYIEGKKVPQFSESRLYVLHKKISDELKRLLTYSSGDGAGMELMNLLLILHKLPVEALPSGEFFESRLLGNKGIKIGNMNFFSVFALEHLTGRFYKESNLQKEIEKWVEKKVEETKNLDSAEAVYVFLTALTCPYFNGPYKRNLCNIRGIQIPDKLLEAADTYSDLFVCWRFDNMLWMNAQKTNAEVY